MFNTQKWIHKNIYIYLQDSRICPPILYSIGHDNMEAGVENADWFLERVEVTCPHDNASWRFSCNDWLAMDKGDGRIDRDLYPQPFWPTKDCFAIFLFIPKPFIIHVHCVTTKVYHATVSVAFKEDDCILQANSFPPHELLTSQYIFNKKYILKKLNEDWELRLNLVDMYQKKLIKKLKSCRILPTVIHNSLVLIIKKRYR